MTSSKLENMPFYEDDDLNARVLSTVAERCYFPGNPADETAY